MATPADLANARVHINRVARNIELRYRTMCVICPGVWDLEVLSLVNRMCDCITITFLDFPELEFEIDGSKYYVDRTSAEIVCPALRVLGAAKIEETDQTLEYARILMTTLTCM